MSSNPEQRERLHEQASAHYLQGDYDEARATWRRLLETDPADQRAADGVRLCEMLDEGGATAPIDPCGETERTLEQLDEALGGNGADWMDDPGAGAGFELSDADSPPDVRVAPVRFDVEAPESMNLDAPSVDPAAVRLDLEDLGLPEDDGLVSSGATDQRAADGAAAELERRANELMSEAMQLYERGAREEALAALNRLSILDEENEAARTFASHIRSEIEAGGPELGFEPDPAPETIHEPPPLVGVNVPPPAPARTTEEPRAEAPAQLASDLTPSGRRTKAKLDVPAPRTLPKRPILIAGGLLIVAVAAFAFLQLSGSGAADDDAAGDAPSGVEPTQHAAIAGAGEAGRKTPATSLSPAAPPAAAAGVDVDALLSRGRTAFESKDYAAAVLAYNQVLAADPTNGEARERLQEAGDLYRAQKAADEGRSEAMAAFGRGEYVEALRLFYRVTPTDDADAARIARYLRNGWYNLGIGALRSGDCKTAREHLREAKQHDAEDEGVRQGLALAAKCSKATLSTEEYESVRALKPRGLDD